MRSSPHVRFAAAMSAISCCRSGGIRGRPRGFDLMRQKSRYRCRCQQTSVSGRTIVNTSRHAMARDSRAKVSAVVGAFGRTPTFDVAGELLAQEGVLSRQVAPRPEGRSDQPREIKKQGERRLNQRSKDGVSGRHRRMIFGCALLGKGYTLRRNIRIVGAVREAGGSHNVPAMSTAGPFIWPIVFE